MTIILLIANIAGIILVCYFIFGFGVQAGYAMAFIKTKKGMITEEEWEKTLKKRTILVPRLRSFLIGAALILLTYLGALLC